MDANEQTTNEAGGERVKISGVINTRNAETYLDAVLSAMGQICDELIVGDMDSSDRTLEIALAHGATVLHLGNLGFPEAGIPAVLAAANFPWILRLDADEVLPKALGERLVAVAEADEADIVHLPIRTWALGRPINHGSFGPGNTTPPRFFKNGSLVHGIHIHGVHRPVAGARELRLTEEADWFEKGLYVEHLSFRGTVDMRSKSVRYTANEADQAEAGTYLKEALRSIARIPYEFFGRFVHRGSYKDRLLAVMMSAHCALYQADRAMRMLQLKFFGTDQEIEKRNHAAATRAVSSWNQAK